MRERIGIMKFNWHNEKRRIKDLIPYVANPRQITEKQAKDLKESLDKFGVADPIIINTDNTIIGGHQRKKILETLMGIDPDYEIDVRVPDRELSIDEMRELNVRLNKNQGEWNFDTLANNFELDDLLDWGFEKSDLDLDLWMPDPPEDAEPQIDRAEELREIWGVETGQLWQLGSHRLICGDCTDKAVVDALMQGEKADMVFTDPPYGISKEGVENDSDLSAYFGASELSYDYLSNNSYFCSFGWVNLIGDMIANTFRYKFLWICVNHTPNTGSHGIPTALGFNEWSPIIVFIKGAPKPSQQIRDYFRNTDQSEVSVIPHPTPKNTEVCKYFIERLSKINAVIYEPFSGSGTTLIACERLNRKCRAVEISPAYVAVAIQRWVDVTGGVPELLQKSRMGNLYYG